MYGLRPAQETAKAGESLDRLGPLPALEQHYGLAKGFAPNAQAAEDGAVAMSCDEGIAIPLEAVSLVDGDAFDKRCTDPAPEIDGAPLERRR